MFRGPFEERKIIGLFVRCVQDLCPTQKDFFPTSSLGPHLRKTDWFVCVVLVYAKSPCRCDVQESGSFVMKCLNIRQI